MICDTPYQSGEQVVGVVSGAVAGAVGGGIMLMVLTIVSGGSLEALLAKLARPFTLAGAEATTLVWTGAATFCFLGALFGLLHAVSQLSVSSRSVVFVGLFYGFFLWLILGVVIGGLAGGMFKTVRSFPFLVAFVLYGGLLGAVAAFSQWRRPGEMLKLPVD